MKTKKFTKRTISIFLSLIMVVTAIPVGGFVALARTNWTLVSSTDFTTVTWSDITNSGNRRYQNGTGFTNVQGGTDTRVEWAGQEYKTDNVTEFVGDQELGVKIRDGYIYLANNYENGESVSSTKPTPVTGLSSFKVDMQFLFYGDFNLTSVNNNKDAFCVIKFKTDDYTSKSAMWENHWFTQAGYGSIYSYGSSSDVISRGTDAAAKECTNYFHFGTSNDKISTNRTYHYIAEYSHGIMHSYVTDASGNVVINYGSAAISQSTDSIKGIWIGGTRDTDYFQQNLAINNIRFYSGDPDTSTAAKDTNLDKDKYLFAYFTGNSDTGEQLRYAVSDDGYNWESLNGGWRVTKDLQGTLKNADPSDDYQIYTTGTSGATGIAASGNIRDPYILEAEDGTYYIVATDLDTGDKGDNFSNNAKFLVWHLNDPADIDSVDPWIVDITGMMNQYVYKWDSTICRAWAPEAIWDPEMNAYMLFFAAANTSWDYGTRMYYTYTRDFKTFITEPKPLLPELNADSIDSTITYYNGLYYMWFKDETNSRLGYATAEHANGPYTQKTTFEPGNYSNVFEGPEVFRLHNSNNYVLIADHFDKISFVAGYQTSAPYGFTSGDQLTQNTVLNINHLKPRHASVCRITTAQYNNLIAKFGRNVWDRSNVESGKEASDYLVARYFTTDDAKFDASGNHYNLDSANPVMETIDGRYCANFGGSTGNGGSVNDNVSKTASINTDAMVSAEGINAKDGVTFDWWGRAYCDLDSVDANNGRFFDWTGATTDHSLVWDNATVSQKDTSFIYCAQNMEFGTNTGYDSWYDRTVSTAFKQKDKNTWHRYTMSISNGWITFWKDGTLLKYVYAADGNSYSTVGTPLQGDQINQALFDRVHKLNFSVSSFAGDNYMWGSISDFRMYKRALTYEDVAAVDTQLDKDGKEVTNGSIIYYDPMEDMSSDDSYDGDVKHVYSASADDTGYGKVLNIAGGVTSHNGDVENASYVDATDTDEYYGYTISFWYKPGATNTQNAIFNIGRCSSGDGTARKEFEITENGGIVYYYDASYEDGTTYIDDNSANVFDGSLTAGTWAHIVMQIVPNGKYDLLKTYVNGTLKSTINVSSYSTHIANNKSLRHYIANHQHNVNYGKSLGTGWYAGRSANASAGSYIDEFKIYSGVIKPSTIIHQDNVKRVDTILADAVKTYKDKMDDLTGAGYVYTNMKAAYDAYDNVQRYDDSVKYGGHTLDVDEVLELASDLKTKTAAMTAYTGPTTKSGFTAAQVGLSSGSVASNYTTNMLSTTDLSNEIDCDGGWAKHYNRSGKNESRGEQCKIYYSSFVWLYKGTASDLKAPINSAFYMSSGVKNRLGSMWVRSGEVAFSQNWKTNKSTSNGWYIGESGEFSYNQGVSIQDYGVDADKWVYASDYITYSPSSDTLSSLNAGTNYLYTTQPTYTGTVYHTWTGGGNNLYDMPITSSSLPTIYVINFVKVNNELTASARVNILDDITDYNASQAKTLLAAYDALTSKSYMVDTVNTANVNSLVSDITSKVSTINTAAGATTAKIDHSAVTAKVASDSIETEFYNAVKDNAGIVTEDGSGHVTSTDTTKKYTTSSLTAYKKAYQKIKSYFYSLNSKDENEPYATDQATIDRLLSNINSAHDHLVRAADFSGIARVAAAATDESAMRLTNNYDNRDNQLYTYASWVAYAQKYDYAKEWYDKPAQFKADIPYYDVPFSKNANGPYIAYDSNNDLVTQSNGKTPSYYVYLGEFYENENDASPSRFETGTWVYTKTDSEDDETVAWSDLGNCRYSPGATDADHVSTLQGLINDAVDDVDDTYDGLVAVDAPEKFETYDTASRVITSSLDTKKYTAAAISYVEDAIDDADDVVYQELNVEQAAIYDTYTGHFVSKVRKAVTDTVDPQTADILSKVDDINNPANKADYIRQYNVTFDIQDDEENPLGTGKINGETAADADIYYGDSFTLTVPDEIKGSKKITKWSTTYTEDGAATLSQKATGRLGSEITKIANSDMAVVAELTATSAQSDETYRYDICNAYGGVVDIIYSNTDVIGDKNTSTFTIDGTTIEAKKVPMYTCTGWTCTEVAANHYRFEPVLSSVPTYNYTIYGSVGTNDSLGGRTVSSVPYDEKLTIEYNTAFSTGTFAAWAVKTDLGKLQIASYSPTYYFYACADETYVPVVNTGTTAEPIYKYYDIDEVDNGVDPVTYNPVWRNVTASSIDGSIANVEGADLNAVVTAKIKNQAPFISIENKVMKLTQARVFARITQGSTIDGTSFGILYRQNVGTDEQMQIGVTNTIRRNITSYVSSGQFSFTLNNTYKTATAEHAVGDPKVFTIDNITFRAFVNYDLSYTIDGHTATINGCDYSATAVATKQA